MDALKQTRHGFFHAHQIDRSGKQGHQIGQGMEVHRRRQTLDGEIDIAVFVVGTVRQRAKKHDPAGLVARDQYARCLGKLGAQSLGANVGLRTSFRRTRAQRLGELACHDHGGIKSSLIAVSVPEGLSRHPARSTPGRQDDPGHGGHEDLLVDLLLVRRLAPWHTNAGKRLVKSPKVYLRDSGIVHALLDIPNKEALLGHPVVGASYEGFVIETLLACANNKVQGYYYRTSGGAEIDLILVWPDESIWAIEVKRSLSPTLGRGFHSSCADLHPTRKLVVYPGNEPLHVAADINALPLSTLARELAE